MISAPDPRGDTRTAEAPTPEQLRERESDVQARMEEQQRMREIGRATSKEVGLSDPKVLHRVAMALWKTYFRDKLDAEPAGWSFRFGHAKRGVKIPPGWSPFPSVTENLEFIKDVLRGEQPGVGTYHLPNMPSTKTSRVTIDIDGKTPEERIKAEVQIHNLTHFLLRLFPGKPWILERSKGGGGYHVCFFFEEQIEASAAIAFASWVLRHAKLPAETEIYPRQSHATPKQKGNLVAIPGSMYWFKKNGGAILLDRATREPIPHVAWPEELLSITPLSTADIVKVTSHDGIDIFAPSVLVQSHERYNGPFRASAAPVSEISPTYHAKNIHTVEDVLALIHALGRTVTAQIPCSSESHDFTVAFNLSKPLCIKRHAHPEALDGSAILFGEKTKRLGYRCFHNSCSGTHKITIREALELVGVFLQGSGKPIESTTIIYDGESEVASKPTPGDEALIHVHGLDPDEPEEVLKLPRRAKKPSEKARNFMAKLARRELAPREIERWGNIAECYPLWKPKEGKESTGRRIELHCDEHGKFNEIPMCCSNNNTCPGCAHYHGKREADFILQEPLYAGGWSAEGDRTGEGIALIVWDAGPDGTPTEKREIVRGKSAVCRKGTRRKDGSQRAYNAMLPKQLPAKLEQLERDGVTGYTVMVYDPHKDNEPNNIRKLFDIAHTVYDIHMEPAMALMKYAEEENEEMCLDLMKGMRSKVHRTSGPRHGMPWYSESKELEAKQALREAQGLPRKFDGTICTKTKADGSPCCRRGFHRAMDDTRVLAEGMQGYKVLQQAFMILRNERTWGKGNAIVPMPKVRIAPFVSTILTC